MPAATPHPKPTEWAVLTHYVDSKGRVIMHAYGGYDTQSKALTAKKRMERDAKEQYSEAELARATMKVRPIFRDSDEV